MEIVVNLSVLPDTGKACLPVQITLRGKIETRPVVQRF